MTAPSGPQSAQIDYLRVGTEADWQASQLVLRLGEDGIAIQADGGQKQFFGDGLHTYASGLLKTAGDDPSLKAALVPRPTGGTNGQALIQSGSDIVWGNVSGGFDVNTLMAERFAALPSADAVTITVVSDTDYIATPSLGVAGGTLIPPARIGGGSSGPLDYDGDTHFRYSGGPSGNGIDSVYVGPANDVAGASMLLHPEWMTSRGVSRLMVKVKPGSATLQFRVTVGELWEQEQLRRVAVTANATQWIVLDFAAGAASRRVKVELLDAYFGGIIPTVGETTTRPKDRLLYINVGDSFGAGASTPPDGASRLETAPNYVAQALGMDLTNMCISGTGWDPRESNHFALRIPSSLAMSPAVLHLAGSRNDSTDDAYVYPAALAGLALAKDVPFVYATGPAQTAFALVNTAVKNAAAQDGVRFGDMLAVIFGSLTGSDNVHPTFAGHRVLAIAMLAAMDVPGLRAILAAIQRTVPGVTLAASPAGTQQVAGNVTLTATISSPVAVVGAVDFYAGTAYLGRATVTAGVATLVVSSLAIGTYQLSARFAPTANKLRVAPSVSALLSYAITNTILTDIILTNLLVDLDVSLLAGAADASQITTMTPTRGAKLDALTQATSSSRMTYMVDEGDGKPAMRQTTIQGLPAPAWAAPLAAGAQVTVFLVFKLVTPPSANTLYIANRGASLTGLRLSMGTGGPASLALDAGSAVGVPNQIARSGWQVWAIRLEAAGQATVWQNRLTSDLFNASHATMAYAGAGIGGGSGATGAEVRHRKHTVYSGGMADADIQAMLVYLAGLKGVTLDA